LEQKCLLIDFNRKKRKGRKLDYKWKGPYIITKSLGHGLYSLKASGDSNDISRINGAHLKQYLSPLHSVSFTFSIAVVMISYVQETADTTTQDGNTSFQDCNSQPLLITQYSGNGGEMR